MRRILWGLLCLVVISITGCGGTNNSAERPATETPLPASGPSGLGGAGAPAPPPPPPLPN